MFFPQAAGTGQLGKQQCRVGLGQCGSYIHLRASPAASLRPADLGFFVFC